MKRLLSLAAAPVLVAGLTGGGAAAMETDPVKLGGDLVEHLGCLFCHGLGGRQGIMNPNAEERKYIPAWDEADFIERYPEPDKVRETIRKGRFPKRDPQAEGNPIPMPPWGNRLTDKEMDAIIAYIWDLRKTPVATHPKGGRGADEARAAYEPPLPPGRPEPAGAEEEEGHHHEPPEPEADSALAKQGRGLVEYLGCLHCHAVGDETPMENPNAVRKEVPVWDDAEFIRRYPVEDGVRYVIEKGRHPEKDPDADGNPVPMPPFGNQLTEQEVDAIVAYIWSLREPKMGAREAGHHHRGADHHADDE